MGHAWDKEKDLRLFGLAWEGLIAEGIASTMGIGSPATACSRLQRLGTSMKSVRQAKRGGKSAEDIYLELAQPKPVPPVQQELPLAQVDVIALLGVVIDMLQGLSAKVDRIEDALGRGLVL